MKGNTGVMWGRRWKREWSHNLEFLLRIVTYVPEIILVLLLFSSYHKGDVIRFVSFNGGGLSTLLCEFDSMSVCINPISLIMMVTLTDMVRVWYGED